MKNFTTLSNNAAQRARGFGTTSHLLLVAVMLISATGLSGCLVAGYSSSGGAFIWPGGLGVVVVILLVLFLLRRRR